MYPMFWAFRFPFLQQKKSQNVIYKLSTTIMGLHTIDLSFLQKVCLPECRSLHKFAPERLPRCSTWVTCIWFISIIKIVFNMYLSKHSWNTHFYSPTTPRWQPPGYHSLRAFIFAHKHFNLICPWFWCNYWSKKWLMKLYLILNL